MCKNNNSKHPMATVMATVKKTVAYANAHPETFQPGTDSYAFYEQMSALCTGTLDVFTRKEDARPLLDILECFAGTSRPEAKAIYASYLSKPDKPWYNPLVAKIMLMHAIEDVDESNPHAAHVMLIYALHVLEGKGWFHKDEARARIWLERSASLGCAEAGEMLRVMDAAAARKR